MFKMCQLICVGQTVPQTLPEVIPVPVHDEATGKAGQLRVDSNGSLRVVTAKTAGEDLTLDRVMVITKYNFLNLAHDEADPVVKAAAGFLGRVNVIKGEAGATVTFYDNPSAGSGDVLAVIPLDDTGASFEIGRSFDDGCYAVFAGATDCDIAVGYL